VLHFQKSNVINVSNESFGKFMQILCYKNVSIKRKKIKDKDRPCMFIKINKH